VAAIVVVVDDVVVRVVVATVVPVDDVVVRVVVVTVVLVDEVVVCVLVVGAVVVVVGMQQAASRTQSGRQRGQSFGNAPAAEPSGQVAPPRSSPSHSSPHSGSRTPLPHRVAQVAVVVVGASVVVVVVTVVPVVLVGGSSVVVVVAVVPVVLVGGSSVVVVVTVVPVVVVGGSSVVVVVAVVVGVRVVVVRVVVVAVTGGGRSTQRQSVVHASPSAHPASPSHSSPSTALTTPSWAHCGATNDAGRVRGRLSVPVSVWQRSTMVALSRTGPLTPQAPNGQRACTTVPRRVAFTRARTAGQRSRIATMDGGPAVRTISPGTAAPANSGGFRTGTRNRPAVQSGGLAASAPPAARSTQATPSAPTRMT
jgi:hypothetical protein